jgi:Flp pilus assembly CpaE family ATPase
VLDVPRTCRPVLESLSSVTSTVVVTTQELASVKAASTLADMLRRRYGREKTSVVVSRYDRNAEITKDDVELAVHGDVRFMVPNDYAAALEAQNLGQPLAAVNGSKLAGAMKELASLLAGGVKAAEATPASASGSLIGKLAGLRWKTT